MNIHEKVKIICKEKCILFKDLATKVGITDVGLRQSLKGNPSLSVLKRVALALGVEFLELLDRFFKLKNISYLEILKSSIVIFQIF